jgi:hypothetical protein
VYACRIQLGARIQDIYECMHAGHSWVHAFRTQLDVCMQDTAASICMHACLHAGYSCVDAGRTQLCAAGLITAKLPAAACDGSEEGQQTKFQEVPDPPSPLPSRPLPLPLPSSPLPLPPLPPSPSPSEKLLQLQGFPSKITYKFCIVFITFPNSSEHGC